MKAKSSAHYQREFRKRMREAGLVKKEVWIRPENHKLLNELEKRLREVIETEQLFMEGSQSMIETIKSWTTTELYKSLKSETPFADKRASIELIEGIEPTLHITMHDYGDLPIYVTVAGEQILAEAILWSADEVSDIAGLNDAVLRTHKYFPLSTISIDNVSPGKDYYHMFGALSSTSILANIIFEIEVLASNVIQATEAYEEFLRLPAGVNVQ